MSQYVGASSIQDAILKAVVNLKIGLTNICLTMKRNKWTAYFLHILHIFNYYIYFSYQADVNCVIHGTKMSN